MVDGDALLVAQRLQVVHQGRRGHQPERVVVGSGADRADDLLRLRRGEDELHVRRGLLDELEHRIEALGGDHVGLVNDVDLVAGAHRGEECAFPQVTSLVDAAVGGRVDLDDVDGAWAATRQVTARLALTARVRGRPLLTVEAAGENAGTRRLATATRPGEQVGVVDASVDDRTLQRFGDVLLTDDLVEGVRAVAPVEGQWRVLHRRVS